MDAMCRMPQQSIQLCTVQLSGLSPKSETNNQHQGVGGYAYSNAACLACHPQGEATGTTFNHNATAFPLTGGHIGVDCIQCHANGYQGTTTVCADCHMDNFSASTDPNHVALNMPTDCAMCHTTSQDGHRYLPDSQ